MNNNKSLTAVHSGQHNGPSAVNSGHHPLVPELSGMPCTVNVNCTELYLTKAKGLHHNRCMCFHWASGCFSWETPQCWKAACEIVVDSSVSYSQLLPPGAYPLFICRCTSPFQCSLRDMLKTCSQCQKQITVWSEPNLDTCLVDPGK